MQYDPADLFRVSRGDAKSYPLNLVNKHQYGHRLYTLDTQLTEEKDRVWYDDDGVISLRDLHDHNDTFEDERFGKTEDLSRYLQRKDPLCRYGFITASDSRDPLECTLGMYKQLASHHQIPPGFIDPILSFGFQHLPRDFNLTQFEHHDTLVTPQSDIIPLPTLGRSGREIRLFFNLRAIEPSTSEKDWRWSMRNVAVYHSFDVETGRAFWLHIKANDKLEERISRSTAAGPRHTATALRTLDGSFRATLDTFFIFFDWADESTRDYVNELDEALRNIIVKAKIAPVDRFAKMPEELMQSLSRSGTADVAPVPRSNSFAAGLRSLSNLFQKQNGLVQPSIPLRSPAAATSTKPVATLAGSADESEKRFKSMMVLETFTFDEMQKLQGIGERIQEALLVVKTNGNNMKEIGDYYEEIVNSAEFPRGLRDACKTDLTGFKRKMKNIERNLGARQAQLETLARNLQEGKVLFDGILQYRSVQISRLFAESAYVSSQRMEQIAFKTEQETASMHIITIVTLLFLPGTFIATFFQSGIIKLKEVENMDSDWVVLEEAMVLFERICFPMMALIFLIWLGIYTWVRRRSKNRPHGVSSIV
ncbi:hypothetical protein V8F06_010368 [Rhypophila decipiens]